MRTRTILIIVSVLILMLFVSVGTARMTSHTVCEGQYEMVDGECKLRWRPPPMFPENIEPIPKLLGV